MKFASVLLSFPALYLVCTRIILCIHTILHVYSIKYAFHLYEVWECSVKSACSL